MSMKPDYEAAAQVFRVAGYNNQGIRVLLDQAVDAALGGDPLAWALDWLIAEGGEITEAFQPQSTPGLVALRVEEPGRYLVYGPLSETPEVPT